MSDTIPPLKDGLYELMQFLDEHPELSEDDLLDEMEQRFSKEVLDAFTATFMGITPE